jgi:FkbM family methyltransferase
VDRGQRVRNGAKRLSRRVGLEGALERVWELRHPSARRDRIDNEHLRLLLAFSLRPDSNCIDVGAHRGDVLKELVRLAPRGRHIAYEPVPGSYEQLRDRFPGVEVRNAAVSNEGGEADFVVVKELPSLSGLREREYAGSPELERIKVRTERLDSALPEAYAPDFIKVDVEGGEREVFEGAIETLRRHRPVIWFEHGAGAADYFGTSPADVHALLVGEVGLRIFDADGQGPYSRAEFEAVFNEPMWSFVARP